MQKLSKNKQPPKMPLPLMLKWAWLVWLAIFMLWIRIEDVHLIYLSLIGIFTSSLILFSSAATKSNKFNLKTYLIKGLIAGLLVTPLIFLLILFKNSLHAHGFFEIPQKQIRDILINTKYWLLIGPTVAFALYRRKHADRQ